MKWSLTIVAITLAALTGCGRSRTAEAQPGDQLSGLFVVRAQGKTGFINKSGKLVIHPQFSEAAPFSGDGLAVVEIGGRAGYIDKSGKIVINPQFDAGAPFSEGLAAVRVGNAWGFIDKDGKIVIRG